MCSSRLLRWLRHLRVVFLLVGVAFRPLSDVRVVFGSILGARLASQLAERARVGWRELFWPGCWSRGYRVRETFVNTLTTRSPTQPAVRLAAYLEQHHLTKGIGDYWSASIVTVESSDSVVVRPVVTNSSSYHVVRYTRLSSSAWYGGGFEFLVYNATAPGEASTRSRRWHRLGRPNTWQLSSIPCADLGTRPLGTT